MNSLGGELFQRLDHGITIVDVDFVRPQFAASYLIVENGRAAFIDTGPNSAVPRLLAALEAHGLDVDAVDHVIPTHIHLDHAGGAGLLMQHLPCAKLVIHPRGARHMIDPSALMAGVRSVHGDEKAERDYGELVPVAAERVVPTADGTVIELGGRPLRFMDTPGHARHHHCIWDAASRGWFAGDTFGIVYPQLHTSSGPYILPAAAPVQFDPLALPGSVARLLAEGPEIMYLTHYGAVRDIQRLAVLLLEQVNAMVEAACALPDASNHYQRLRYACAEIYLQAALRCGSTHSTETLLEILELDIDLNAQGLGVWLERRMSG